MHFPASGKNDCRAFFSRPRGRPGATPSPRKQDKPVACNNLACQILKVLRGSCRVQPYIANGGGGAPL